MNKKQPFLPSFSVALTGLALFVCTVFTNAQTPFTCEDQFFLTLNTMPPSLNEVIINPVTNNVVFQTINGNINVNINAAGYRSTDNYIYCVDPGNNFLVRLDRFGNGTVLATLPLNPFRSYFAGDISPDGKYLILIGTLNYPTGVSVAADLVRVDLEDPNYSMTSTAITTDALIFDIAFHPVTNVLYGYDSNGHRLVVIDPNTGVISFPFPAAGQPTITGTLFFDAYGTLFVYGSPTDGEDQNSLYKIDVETGVSTFLAKGEAALSSDGCSCPYTVELTKDVLPATTFPCSDVEYTFEIYNTSRRPHQGIRFEDKLPPGFTFVSVSVNDVGGTVVSQPGDNSFVITNIPLPEGKHVIKIIVNTGNSAPGIYKNQAVLSNLPPALGGKRVSDFPKTLINDDSTVLQIIKFDFDTLFQDKALCEGADFIRLDASSFAATSAVDISWQNGATTPYIDVTQPGQYTARLTAGCDTAFVAYNVEESMIKVEVQKDQFAISLGDSIYMEAMALHSDGAATFEWIDPQPQSVRCITCPETWARPFNDILYAVIAANAQGCRDTASVRVTVQKNRAIYFPNVFTPESNDNNNYFYASGDQFVKLESLSIYSRWGEKMFNTKEASLNDPNSGWDGTYRGKPVSPGVYVWQAEVVFLDGKRQRYAGDVTVIR